MLMNIIYYDIHPKERLISLKVRDLVILFLNNFRKIILRNFNNNSFLKAYFY